MSTEQGDDISGHRGTVLCSGFTSALCLEGSVWDLQKLAEAAATSECVLACDLGISCGRVQVRGVRKYIYKAQSVSKNKSTWTQIGMSDTSKFIQNSRIDCVSLKGQQTPAIIADSEDNQLLTFPMLVYVVMVNYSKINDRF